MQFTLIVGSRNATETLLITIQDPIFVDEDASCAVTISGVIQEQAIYGVGPIAALENALQFVKTFLANSNQAYFWENGTEFLC